MRTFIDNTTEDIDNYLLAWKKRNEDDYKNLYGELNIIDLSLKQLVELFSYATSKDGAKLYRVYKLINK